MLPYRCSFIHNRFTLFPSARARRLHSVVQFNFQSTNLIIKCAEERLQAATRDFLQSQASLESSRAEEVNHESTPTMKKFLLKFLNSVEKFISSHASAESGVLKKMVNVVIDQTVESVNQFASFSQNERLQNIYIFRQVFYDDENDKKIENLIESLILKDKVTLFPWLKKNDQKIRDYHQYLFLNIMKIRGIFLDIPQNYVKKQQFANSVQQAAKNQARQTQPPA